VPRHLALPDTDRYDTIVAGAGPAGIMAAREAAARGRVLLIEACSLPRDKSCGGMLHEDAQAFLAPIAQVPDDIVLSPSTVNFRYVDWDRDIRKATSLTFKNVDRPGFDTWLLSTLPDEVDLVEGASIDSFVQDAEGVNVTIGMHDGPLTVRCANLIGADGARSVVRRALAIGSVATYVTLQDWVRLDGEIEPYFDCIYMRDVGDCFAYGYVVPKGDHAIIGSVFYPKTRRPHEKQDYQMRVLRERMPQLGESDRREAWVALQVRSSGDVVPGAGRVLLTGEAAGFMSPTSGEGISYALKSGAACGIAVARSKPEAALDAYLGRTKALRRDIARRLMFLPVMESRFGKYMAGLTPTPVVSMMTKGL
jgi:flavin-dependent dehydrogenase